MAVSNAGPSALIGRPGRYVLLEGAASSASRDELGGSPADKSELVAVLREQLAAERQVHAEARRIIAGLVERIPGHRGPTGAPEASATVEEEPERAEPHSAMGEPQEPVQRPGWRRVFGR